MSTTLESSVSNNNFSVNKKYNYNENGHLQYAWSTRNCLTNFGEEKLSLIRKMITEFYFQLVRQDDHENIRRHYKDILSTVFSDVESRYTFKPEINILARLIANTRDIIAGKGEQKLAFMQIYEWYPLSPEMSKFLFHTMIHSKSNGKDIHPYGSMKDIKYFLKYLQDDIKMWDEMAESLQSSNDISVDKDGTQMSISRKSKLLYDMKLNMYNDFKDYIFEICKNILEADEAKQTDGKMFSLFAKWFPREKSKKFGFIFSDFSVYLYNNYFYNENGDSITNTTTYSRAVRLAKMNLRKRLAKLNKVLQTTQIAMSSTDKVWNTIDFNKVTSKTLNKNRLAFQNLNKDKSQRSDERHRVHCAENLKEHVQKSMTQMYDEKPAVKINARRCDTYELVKAALDASTSDDVKLVNAQWLENGKNNDGLKNIISLVDVSGSMECDNYIPLYNAIGLGLRASEKNTGAFKNRIITFETNPRWVTFAEDSTFHEKVIKLKEAPWGGSTNIKKAFEIILEIIVTNNVSPSVVENMVLAIFSDMQFNESDRTMYNVSDNGQMPFYEEVKQMYADAGLKSSYCAPYSVPHILFWNLRTTKGFPVLTSQENVSMLSGYNSSLLNTFCNKGFDELKKFEPIKFVEDILANERYNYVEEGLNQIMYCDN